MPRKKSVQLPFDTLTLEGTLFVPQLLDELRYILDPANNHGPDYPTETVRGLNTKELKKHGEYRTQRLVLEAWDRLIEG